MTIHRLPTFLAALFLVSGCGVFGSTTGGAAHTTTADGDSFESSAFAWQAEVEQAALTKITEPLWLWLDGDQPSEIDVLGSGAEPTVRVTVELRHPLYEDEIDHYTRLGLDAEEGEDRPSGTVTRTQLLELASDRNVLRLDPEGAATERAEATARAETRRNRGRRRL